MNLIKNGEGHLKSLIIKNKVLLFLTIVTILAVLIRYFERNFVSGDYTASLHPWFINIRHMGGVAALRHQVGDYNIFYQFLIAIFTYFPFKDLYMYKALSDLFDFFLACSTGMLVASFVSPEKKQKYFAFTYAIVLFLPTVILNSGAWAQCDSIYATFIVLSLFFLFKDRYISSFIMLGIAFGFKFQTIFILPFFLFVWLVNNKIYIWHFAVAIFTFWLSGVPGYIFGRNPLEPFTIYLNQANHYTFLFMDYFNFPGMFLGKNAQDPATYFILSKVFVLGTFLVLLIGYMFFLYRKDSLTNFHLIIIAVWTIYTCVMFLPAMHERYAFVVDILMIVLVMLNKKYILVAIPEILNSLLSYSRFLFWDTSNAIAYSYISLIVYLVFSIMLCTDFNKLKVEFKKEEK